MASINLKQSDLKRALVLAERIHHVSPQESFSNHAFVVLSNALSWTHFTVDRYSTNPIIYQESINNTVPKNLIPAFSKYSLQHPLFSAMFYIKEYELNTILNTVSQDEFHQTDLYKEFYKPLNIEDQLIVGMRSEKEIHAIAYSRDSAFTERDISFMNYLLPHIGFAWEKWHCIRELEERIRQLENDKAASNEEEQDRLQAQLLMDRLTPRQRQIAELVAQGMENRKIADKLYIAPKTVGKHLENIFEALEIHHRAALAAKWSQLKK